MSKAEIFVHSWISHKNPLATCLPSRCGLTGALATACGDDAVRVFREEDTTDPDQPVFYLAAQLNKAHSQDVNCVTWNPKRAGLLASCSDDGEIAIWQLHEEHYWILILETGHLNPALWMFVSENISIKTIIPVNLPLKENCLTWLYCKKYFRLHLSKNPLHI